jgi:uncharacterized oligopeptide transporter (OPT) family protein
VNMARMVNGEVEAHNVFPFCLVAGVLAGLLPVLSQAFPKWANCLPSGIGFAIGLCVFPRSCHVCVVRSACVVRLVRVCADARVEQLPYAQLDVASGGWRPGQLAVAPPVASRASQLHDHRFVVAIFNHPCKHPDLELTQPNIWLTVASGFVLGEGTMSVVTALFMAAGIPPLF